MNVVDLLIILVLASSAFHGIWQGAAIQLLSFGGFWGGFSLGVVLAPVAAGAVSSPFGRALTSVLAVFGTAALAGAIGRQLGVRVWSALRRLRLGPLDAAVGAGVAVVATLLAVWLIGGMLALVPVPGISGAVHESKISRAIIRGMPPAPAVVARLSKFLTDAGFPPVFAELEPSPAPDVALPDDPAVREAVAAAAESTVKIVGFGCGGQLTGSGFVVAPGLVVTNAHVVAGIDRPLVEDRRGRHRATPVIFDPNLDIAILRAGGLAGRPLALVGSPVARGTGGAVLGFPAGGPFTATPAAVRDRFDDAVGRDIYNRGTVSRDVYQLQTEVHPGNSGGPFVRPGGEVAGVIFSRSAVRRDVGYALTSVEVGPLVDQARGMPVEAAAGTGPCAA